MNIKDIVDKIIKEGDINPTHYTPTDRLVDVNSARRFLREKATQLGARFPALATGEALTQTETTVQGDNTFTRDVPYANIVSVEFSHDGTYYDDLVPRHILTKKNVASRIGDVEFKADEKNITIKDALAGTIRITYEHGNLTDFDIDDYNAGTPPTPDDIPTFAHDLLWMRPLLMQTAFYKSERYAIIKERYDELFDMFLNHYDRVSENDLGTFNVVQDNHR